MSNMLSEIVKRTEIKGALAKALMRHIADTMRDRGDWYFWESRKTTAAYLGTDRATIQRNMRRLEDAGLIFCQTERAVKGGYVNVYMVDVEALLSLPCVDEIETRRECVKRLVEVEGYIHPANFPDACPASEGAGENSKGAGENSKGAGENSEGAGETGTIPINPNRSLIEPVRARDLSDHSLSESNPNVVTPSQRRDKAHCQDNCLEKEKPKHDFGPELAVIAADIERSDREADRKARRSADEAPRRQAQRERSAPDRPDPEIQAQASSEAQEHEDTHGLTSHGAALRQALAQQQAQRAGGKHPRQPDTTPASGDDWSTTPAPASEHDRQAGMTGKRKSLQPTHAVSAGGKLC